LTIPGVAWAVRRVSSDEIRIVSRGNFHVIASLQQFADWLIALNRADDGMQISFSDFRECLDLLSREVLPLLRDVPTSRERDSGDNSCQAFRSRAAKR